MANNTCTSKHEVSYRYHRQISANHDDLPTSLEQEPFWATHTAMKVLIDKLARMFLSDEAYGMYRYRRYPASGRAWGGAMNGQKFRCLLVAELIHKLRPKAIVETGTYLGTTTEWLASFQIPIHSCEAMPENYGFSKARLATTWNAHVTLSDSRRALTTLLDGTLRDVSSEVILFYLDAHWFDDLPLEDELAIIFSRCPRAIVLVDDFEVPHDSGYGYDDYGTGKSLTHAYLDKTIATHRVSVRYPTTPSSEETGSKRGCVLLSGPALAQETADLVLATISRQ